MGVLLFVCCYSQPVLAQIGEHRDDFSIGFNGGYVLSNVGFVPKVNQKQHGGITGGLALRYKSEKYFYILFYHGRNKLCSIGLERGHS